jgi:hypothetical protein
MNAIIRIGLWIERHRRLVDIASWTVFAIVCARYAGFIKLPVILDIPAQAAALMAGLRYAVWDGILKPRVEARIAAASEADAPLPEEAAG